MFPGSRGLPAALWNKGASCRARGESNPAWAGTSESYVTNRRLEARIERQLRHWWGIRRSPARVRRACKANRENDLAHRVVDSAGREPRAETNGRRRAAG